MLSTQLNKKISYADSDAIQDFPLGIYIIKGGNDKAVIARLLPDDIKNYEHRCTVKYLYEKYKEFNGDDPIIKKMLSPGMRSNKSQ